MPHRLLPLIVTSKSWIGILFATFASILFPITPILYALLVLIFVDNITGIMAYFYKHGHRFIFWKWSSWKHIKSSKLGDSLSKTLGYMLLAIAGFVIDTYLIHNSGLYFTKILSGAMAFRELISITENVGIITNENLLTIVKVFITKGWKAGARQILNDTEKEKETN